MADDQQGVPPPEGGGTSDPYGYYSGVPEVRPPEQNQIVKATQAPPPAEEDEEDDGMLRMSFMEHLEELRSRIIRALMGLGISFILCIVFAN